MTMDRESARRIYDEVDKVRRYSDRLIGIGPFGIGLDTVLAWVPVAGTAYSGAASAFLLVQALRAGASGATMARMLAYLGLNTATSTIPVIGYAADSLFPGILMAAKALMKDIDARYGVAPPKKRWFAPKVRAPAKA